MIMIWKKMIGELIGFLIGLVSKLLQELFCRDFLTPLEQTDVCYSLQTHMIHSANLHDDLDVVTSVYLSETSYSRNYPSFDQDIFNPNRHILDISTNYSEKHRVKAYDHVHRFFNHPDNHLKHANNLSKFIDYTSITCYFSIPIQLPNVIYVHVIIFNRDNNNSITTTSNKNISLQDILQLIECNKKFHDEPMLPINSSRISSPTTMNNMTHNDLVMINTTLDNNNDDDEPLNDNIAVCDEKLL
ncbi:unnamed protein product [Rotaria sp. Silwood1]|nr:unnamed protein product [Rotaria sp. Silwood1]